ncbi:unnamed protein product [Pieris brassicae]|uniref:Uncharacterized protein n=1 Tax=Pieris brassicae TaxID=7116 RepID=A0A9P0XJ15_PIEBR|nr:unnamed protein product [Pieris brassicae]
MFFIWLILALAIYDTTAEIPKDLEVLIDLSDQVRSTLRNSGPMMLVPNNLRKRSKGRMNGDGLFRSRPPIPLIHKELLEDLALLLNHTNCFIIDILTAKKNKEINLNVIDPSKVPLAESHRNRPNDVLTVLLKIQRNSCSKYKELKPPQEDLNIAKALKDISNIPEIDSLFIKRDVLDIVTLPILIEVKKTLKHPLNITNVDNKVSLKDFNLQDSRKNFDLIDFIKSRNVRTKAHSKKLTKIPDKLLENKLGGFNNFAPILLSGDVFDF